MSAATASKKVADVVGLLGDGSRMSALRRPKEAAMAVGLLSVFVCEQVDAVWM